MRGAARPRASTSRTLALDTDARRLPARPGRDPLRARASCSAATPQLAAARRDAGAAEGQLDFGGDGADAAPAGRPARRWPSTAWSARSRGARRAGHARAATTRSRSRSCGVLARMEDVGIGVDVAELRAPQRAADGRVRARSAREIWRRRRARSSTSTPPLQLREILFDELGLHAAEEDQDRLLHRRRRRSRSCAASTRSSSTCCATARSRSCGRPTARGCWPRWRPTAASTPRSTRPWPAPAGCQLRRSRTCTTSRCAARRAGSSARRSCPRPGYELLVADYNQIELRCIAHLAEDPGLIAAFESRPGHPQRHRGAGVRRRARRRSRSSSGRRRRWSSYGLAYGMEAYGLGQRLNIPTEEAQRSSTPTSRPSRT